MSRTRTPASEHERLTCQFCLTWREMRLITRSFGQMVGRQILDLLRLGRGSDARVILSGDTRVRGELILMQRLGDQKPLTMWLPCVFPGFGWLVWRSGNGHFIRRSFSQSPVETMPIVISSERLQFLSQVPLAPEQHPVQILPPESADEPLNERMGDGHIRHRLNHPNVQNP